SRVISLCKMRHFLEHRLIAKQRPAANEPPALCFEPLSAASWLHSALDTCVDRIEGRRAADVQSVSLLATEAQIGHRLRYVDLADQFAGDSNGNTIDREGRLITCEHSGRRVTRTELDGSITIIADSYNGKNLNSPNDAVVAADGSIWFTDPIYGIGGYY